MTQNKVKVIRMPLSMEQIKNLPDHEMKIELARFLLQYEDKFNEELDKLKGKEFIEAFMQIYRLL